MLGIKPNVPVAEWTDAQLHAVEAQISERNPPTSGPRLEKLEEIQKELKNRATTATIKHHQV